jgi:hypothetical protein
MLSAVAYASSRRRSLRAYIYAVAGLWLILGVPFGRENYRLGQPRPLMPNLPHFLDYLIATAPIVLIPGALLLFCVSGRLRPLYIPVIAILGALVSIPFVFVFALYSSCYLLHECP